MRPRFIIVEQTSDVLVIDKAPEVSFHSESGVGLFASVKQELGLSTLYPVHRLDKVTSGIVVFAKTKQMADQLRQAFEARQVEKYYWAISLGKPKKKQGSIKGDMLKSRNGSYKLSKTTDNPASTQFFSYSLGKSLRVYLLRPLSGKTHQLRVMLKSLSVPILGDVRYGGAEAERTYLHAYSIAFRLNQETHTYRSQYHWDWHQTSPSDELLHILQHPEQLPWPKI